MLRTSLTLIAAATGASLVFAQQQYSAPANATSLALIEAQFDNAGLNTPIENGQSLGQPLNAEALLSVTYGETEIVTGNAYPADAVAQRPTLALYPAAGANFSADSSYTLALVDFSAIAQPDPEAEYRHYLANDVTVTANEDGSLGLSNGTVITYYAGPGPIVATGAHRYSWLLFEQPADFAAPANLSTPGVGPSHWNFPAYVQETGLGAPIAANFFTVENGAPSVPAVSTSAVNTATLEVSSSSAAASGTAATSATRGSGAAAAASSSAASAAPTGSATGLSAPVAGALAVVVGGMVAMLA